MQQQASGNTPKNRPKKTKSPTVTNNGNGSSASTPVSSSGNASSPPTALSMVKAEEVSSNNTTSPQPFIKSQHSVSPVQFKFDNGSPAIWNPASLSAEMQRSTFSTMHHQGSKYLPTEIQPVVSHWPSTAATAYAAPYYSSMNMDYISPMHASSPHHHAHHSHHQQLSSQHLSQMSGQHHINALG
ncbi:hypothetical protein RvY_19658, partial [Ramazzottius varieornatus]